MILLVGGISGFFLIAAGEAQVPVMSPEPPLGMTLPVGQGAEVTLPADGLQGAGGLDTPKQRDPFWPVGYVPKKEPKIKEKGTGKTSIPVVASPESTRNPAWDEARRKMDIRGISLIHDKNSKTLKYLAMVAGKLVEAGDVVTVKYDGYVYRWRVAGISEEGVSLRKLDVRGD